MDVRGKRRGKDIPKLRGELGVIVTAMGGCYEIGEDPTLPDLIEAGLREAGPFRARHDLKARRRRIAAGPSDR